MIVACLQVGLVDNSTEYMTVVNSFKSALQSKRGREPPSVAGDSPRAWLGFILCI